MKGGRYREVSLYCGEYSMDFDMEQLSWHAHSQMCYFQWKTSQCILRWIFNGVWHGTTAVITCPFRIVDVICGVKARHMADGEKCNIPLDGYGKRMSLGLQPDDIPMLYPPHGILCFYPSAKWSCYNIQMSFEGVKNVKRLKAHF